MANAKIAEIAGIKKLKIYNTGNIKMWKHPKYYKDLRKLYRSRNRDQAISKQDPTGSKERAPGPGLKLNPKPAFVIKGTSSKHQASSKVNSKAFKIIKP